MVISRYRAPISGIPTCVIKRMIHLQSTDGLMPKHVNWDPVSILNGHFQYTNTELQASTVSLQSWKKGLPIGVKETQCTYDDGLLIHYRFESAGYQLLNIEDSRNFIVHSMFRTLARHHRD